VNRLTDRPLRNWIDALARETPVPAGGALALVTLAGSAALAAKVARLTGRDPDLYDHWAEGFLKGAERDGEAYLAARNGSAADIRACLGLSVEQLESAVSFLESLEALFEGLSPALKADAAAAERGGRASARTLLVNLAVNLAEWSERVPGLDQVASSLADLQRRLQDA
jgi:formiminotetrahydrofolate cyclodeaminase